MVAQSTVSAQTLRRLRNFAAEIDVRITELIDSDGLIFWRLEGKLVALYDPRTGALHVTGTRRARVVTSPFMAALAAISAPPRWGGNRTAPMGSRRKRNVRALLSGTSGETDCHWCGRSIHGGELTIDHIIPLSRNGTHEDNNVVAACRPCNDMRADEMIELHGWIPKGGSDVA